MTLIVQWSLTIIVVLQKVLATSAQESRCRTNFTLVSNKCVYVAPKTDWFTAVRRCSLEGANITLVNITVDELGDVISYLKQRNVKTAWIPAKRNRAFDPITFQLPTSRYYGKKISIFHQTLHMWLENEPAQEGANCMAIAINDTRIFSKMDNCNDDLHHTVCMKTPSGSEGDLQQHVISPLVTPEMQIRKVNNNYFLDVYNPHNLWNFEMSGNEVRNPICLIEDGNARIDNCMLDQQEKLMWNAQNMTEKDFGTFFQYFITKEVYKVISETEGHLICHAFIAGTMDRITTERTVYRRDWKHYTFTAGLQYSVRLCSLELCEPTYSYDHWNTLALNLSKALKADGGFKKITVHPVRMIDRVDDIIALIFRIKIATNSSVEDADTDYTFLPMIKAKLNSVASNETDGLVKVLYVRSTQFCHKEELPKNESLHWETAAIGQTILPNELCLIQNNMSVYRQCTGNFVIGGFWFSKNEGGQKETCIQASAITENLYNLSQFSTRKFENASSILEKLENVLSSQDINNVEAVNQFTQVDIHYVAKIMKNIKQKELHDSDLPLIANIADSILKTTASQKEMKSSQKMINASNVILESLDSMLNGIELNDSEALVITPRFVTLVMDIEPNSTSYNGIQGLASLQSKDFHFVKENIVSLPWGMTLEELLTMDVSAAVFLPPQIRLNEPTSVRRLVINLFWDDSLFKSRNEVPSHVISVMVDGVRHQDLNPPLMLIFNNTAASSPSSRQRDCVFWDFEANEGNGNWSTIGCTSVVTSDKKHSAFTGAEICICTHLTHFGHLLLPSFQEEVDAVLDFITIVGCSISLLGIFGIGLTACVFPDWRQGASKKIQLHLSASLGMLMSVFLLNELLFRTPEEKADSWMCFIMGIVLHFAVISTFCWMLVAAWFQYLRLTKPLASRHRTPHILLKSGAFAWGVPSVPCGILLLVSPASYSSSQCYPTGLAHSLSVLLPVALIISLNIGLYVLIVCSIYNLDKSGVSINLKHHGNINNKFQKRSACRRLSTLVFLFFLLGLSWLFGIWKLSYLFCSVATLQGFAFFIFFVILEKNSRYKWSQVLTKKRRESRLVLSSRSSTGSVMKRWSHTSRQTVSTLSSLS